MLDATRTTPSSDDNNLLLHRFLLSTNAAHVVGHSMNDCTRTATKHFKLILLTLFCHSLKVGLNNNSTTMNLILILFTLLVIVLMKPKLG